MKSYNKEDYLSVWIGKCKSLEEFNKCIYLLHDSEGSNFKLGQVYEVRSYEEEYSLVNYLDNYTRDLNDLLNTGTTDEVINELITKFSDKVNSEYNCCFMAYDLAYDGHINQAFCDENEFLFLGCIQADKFDLI